MPRRDNDTGKPKGAADGRDKDRTDLLRGTFDLLILKTLALEPLLGVAIADRIAQVTGGTFSVQAGSLFPALHRLEGSGWIAGAWTTTADGRRVKAYTLLAAGRRQLTTETRQWEKIVAAVGQVLHRRAGPDRRAVRTRRSHPPCAPVTRPASLLSG